MRSGAVTPERTQRVHYGEIQYAVMMTCWKLFFSLLAFMALKSELCHGVIELSIKCITEKTYCNVTLELITFVVLAPRLAELV